MKTTTGDFVLHLDGQADDFLPDNGLWQWRYWGKGNFTPMNARWDVRGTGEWRDNVIELTDLSTGFDKLQYGTMTGCTSRAWRCSTRSRWIAGPGQHPTFTGALALDAGEDPLYRRKRAAAVRFDLQR